ncbi:MAG: hypothetical protein ACKV19_25095 [Verrucomicrobiales bacterium]
MSIPPIIAALVWDPVLPPIVIVLPALALAGFATWTYLRTGPRLAPRQRRLLLALRLSSLALVAVLLFQPTREESIARRHPKRLVLAALDVSQSMAETDGPDQSRRLDAARRALAESGLFAASELGELRVFAFDADARIAAADVLPSLAPVGETTRFHQSLTTLLGTLRPGEQSAGLFLFTDGHDFEKVSAARTGQAARARRTPIFPVMIGKPRLIPDVAVHMASHQPFTFVGQRVRLQAVVRFTASENQPVRVELLREGVVVRDRLVDPGGTAEADVTFEVSEDQPGQYEYEIRAIALPGERDTNNNGAFTFLNVTNSRIPVLMLEGEPHWDTTFLQRTLSRNKRIALDAAVGLGGGSPRLTRYTAGAGVFTLPRSQDEFQAYPVIVLGRGLDRLLEAEAVEALTQAVSEGGTTLVLARGAPGEEPHWQELAPAEWQSTAAGPVKVSQAGGGGEFVPWDVLRAAPGGVDNLPALPLVRTVQPPKTLAAVEAMAEDVEQKSVSPAILHRRHGSGQVLAVAVEGLWKWSLNAKGESTNNIYDRFWNQLVLNLVARSNLAPTDRPQLTVTSANLQRGEKVQFRLVSASGRPLSDLPPLTIRQDARHVADVALEKSPDAGQWQGEWVAGATGRYRAVIMAGGEEVSCRFAVFEELREATDLAPDPGYLRKLAESSGGRALELATLPDAVNALRQSAIAEAQTPPMIRRTSLWDKPHVFYLLCALLGLEWTLRRRWGLT